MKLKLFLTSYSEILNFVIKYPTKLNDFYNFLFQIIFIKNYFFVYIFNFFNKLKN